MKKNQIELNGKKYGVYLDVETYELYGEKMGYKDFDQMVESLTGLYVKNEKTGKESLAIGAIKRLSCFLFCGLEVYADHHENDLDLTEKTVKRLLAENFETLIPEVTDLLLDSFGDAAEMEDGQEEPKKKQEGGNESAGD